MLETIDLKKIIAIAKDAGGAIVDIYQKDFAIEYKDDNSPLTEADLISNRIICNALTKLYPKIPILSEENKMIDYNKRKDWNYFWLIDPIDGTKEFIKRNGEFTVNIALVKNRRPILGVVYAPILEDMYSAKEGFGAFKNGQKLPIYTNEFPKEKLRVVASKSHLSEETQNFIDTLDTKEITQVSKGSSLKLCMVAEGIADIYPRLAPTMEWDTAASHAIVIESGKEVINYNNEEPLLYNKKNLLNPWFIVK
jgi:3'(2'), 5'-bisphosphate nucleotidase